VRDTVFDAVLPFPAASVNFEPDTAALKTPLLDGVKVKL